MNYTIRLYDLEYRAILLPPGLSVDVVRYAWAAMGGPETAELAFSGVPPALAQIAGWLRCPLEILDDSGRPVWWGYVEGLTLEGATATVGVSLANMVNRCAVVYRPEPGSSAGSASGRRLLTAWAEDSASVAQYGRKEARIVLGSPITPAGAEEVRDRHLAAARAPVPRIGDISTGPREKPEGPASVVIAFCRGWWSTLDWQYYRQSKGVEASPGLVGDGVGQAGASLKLGQGFSGNRVSFGQEARRISDLDGRCQALAAGDILTVTGSALNDGVYTVEMVHQVSVRVYQSAGLSFIAATRRIVDGSGGLGFLDKRDCICLSGSGANDGYYTVVSLAADGSYAEVAQRLVDEGTGAPVTVSRGNWVVVREPLVEELPGANVSIEVVPGQVAQAVQLAPTSPSWPCVAVTIRAARVGAPAGGLRVAVCADESGRPGAELATAEIASEVIGPGLGDVAVNLDQPVELAATRTCWLVIRRASQATAEDYYRLAIDEISLYPRGLLFWRRGAGAELWQPRIPAANLCFLASGAQDSLEQVREALGTAQFMTGVDLDLAGADGNSDSGVQTCPYRTGERRLGSEVVELLRLGSSGGHRIMATVMPDRRAVISVEPHEPDPGLAGETYSLCPDGRLRGPYGEHLPVGQPVVGVWLATSASALLTGAAGIVASSPAFVERCVIDAETGRWTLETRLPAEPTDDWLARLRTELLPAGDE